MGQSSARRPTSLPTKTPPQQAITLPPFIRQLATAAEAAPATVKSPRRERRRSETQPLPHRRHRGLRHQQVDRSESNESVSFGGRFGDVGAQTRRGRRSERCRKRPARCADGVGRDRWFLGRAIPCQAGRCSRPGGCSSPNRARTAPCRRIRLRGEAWRARSGAIEGFWVFVRPAVSTAKAADRPGLVVVGSERQRRRDAA